ncbi:DUF4129 domain-containing protein [Aliifodinibius sp. S!AR15-10]|nr:DUF4129 domain-containing protein [Aliifodinibius sp. S!AR15-10]
MQPINSTAHILSQTADTSAVEVRLPSEQQLDTYSQQNAFDYSQEAVANESFISKVLRWLFSWFGDIMQNPTAAIIFEIAAYLIFISLLILLIQQYFKGNLADMMTKNKVHNGLPATKEAGPLVFDELNALINKAIEQNRYRDAICHLYRRSLKQLAEAGHITWKKDKTNRDYLYELSTENMRSLFQDITRYYEYAEYGHFPFDQELFGTVHQRFKQLHKLISDQN